MLPTHPNTQPLVVTAVTLVLVLLLFSSFPDVYRITDRHVLDPTPTCPISPLVESIYAHDVAPRVASDSTPFHYLDFTGSSIYTTTQASEYHALLSAGVYGNPHSKSLSSRLSTQHVNDMRQRILEYFNADPDEYMVVFTRSATGALNLLGEAFPFTDQSQFVYLEANHNSVLGVRSYAQKAGARVGAMTEDEVERWLASDGDEPSDAWNLLAYPAKDNFEGVLYPLEWIERVHEKKPNWLVLLDTAAFAPTYRLDLSVVKPDFAVVSWYKVFGLPSGVGSWIVKRSSEKHLQRVFWGGSSVFTATAGHGAGNAPWEVRFQGEARYEDGTLPFLEIGSLRTGFDLMDRLGGIDSVQEYVTCLGKYLSSRLQSLRHSNGVALVKLNGKHYTDPKRQSGIASFQLVRPEPSNGSPFFSYRTAALVLAEAGFQIRDGCACCPGACYRASNVTEAEVRDKATRANGDYEGWEYVQRGSEKLPLGALRASLGWLSRARDVDALVDFLAATYIDATDDVLPTSRTSGEGGNDASRFGC